MNCKHQTHIKKQTSWAALRSWKTHIVPSCPDRSQWAPGGRSSAPRLLESPRFHQRRPDCRWWLMCASYRKQQRGSSTRGEEEPDEGPQSPDILEHEVCAHGDMQVLIWKCTERNAECHKKLEDARTSTNVSVYIACIMSIYIHACIHMCVYKHMHQQI